jgi:hypothetical protein
MRNRITLAAALFAGLAMAPNAMVSNATAQTVGVFTPAISADQAQEIAALNGVIGIRKIEFDDRMWKIEGLDRAGRRVEMKISPNTGEIVRLERFD